MVERVNLPQPLIEERLRLRVLRRNGMVPIAVAGHEHGGLGLCRDSVPGMPLRKSGLG